MTDSVNWEFARAGALPSGWAYADAHGCTDPSNVWVSGGSLAEQVGPVGDHPYCGARVQTQRTFNPPFSVTFRARYQLPAGVHTGATLYGAGGDPWPWSGEVDMSEMSAKSPTKDHVRLWAQHLYVHHPARCGDSFDLGHFDPTVWHVYGADVRVDSVTFTLDGTPIHTTTAAAFAGKRCSWPYNQRAGLRMFLGVSVGGWGGTPDSAKYPCVQQFDYVRIAPLTE